MTSYCLGYLFNPAFTWVMLIRKQRPEWQKGCMNGVGGKVEEGETPRQAMVREFTEETGLVVPLETWHHFACLRRQDHFEMHCFYGVSNAVEPKVTADEQAAWYAIGGVLQGTWPRPLLGNLKWQLQLALAVARGEERCTEFNIEETAWKLP